MRKDIGSVLAALVLFGAALIPRGAAAPAAQQVPPIMQAAILVKSLAYELNLGKAEGPVVIGFLAAEDNLESINSRRELIQGIAGIDQVKIHGRAVRIVQLESLQALEAARLDVLYLAPGLDERLQAILAYTHQKKILTATGVEGYMRRGVSLGIIPKEGNKPQIAINVPASVEEGARFDSRLLRLALLIKDTNP